MSRWTVTVEFTLDAETAAEAFAAIEARLAQDPDARIAYARNEARPGTTFPRRTGNTYWTMERRLNARGRDIMLPDADDGKTE